MTALYPLALGVTLGSELLGAGLVGSLVLRRSVWRCLLLCLLINLLVHPLFWTGFSHLPGGYGLKLLCGESLVVLVEGGLYRVALRLPWASALALSLALNVLSTAAGLLLWSVVSTP